MAVNTENMEDLQNLYDCGFNKLMGVRIVEVAKDHAEAELTIGPEHLQPHGFLHGGATLALLEVAASAATCANADLETQLPFGVGIHVRHRKAGVAGVIKAVARLNHQEISSYSGALKQTWDVAAYDEAGDVISEGTFDSKIVSREYYASKQAAQR